MKNTPGPKLEPAADLVRPRTYNVDRLTEQRLDALGNGNRSRGVREASRIAYEWYQRQVDPPK